MLWPPWPRTRSCVENNWAGCDPSRSNNVQHNILYISILLHLLWTYHHNSPKSNMTLWRSCNSAFIRMLIPTRGCRGQMHNIVFSKKYQLDASGQCYEKGHLPCKLLWAWFEHNRQRFCSSWIWYLNMFMLIMSTKHGLMGLILIYLNVFPEVGWGVFECQYFSSFG